MTSLARYTTAGPRPSVRQCRKEWFSGQCSARAQKSSLVRKAISWVAGLDLAHDVAHVSLDGALAHIELVTMILLPHLGARSITSSCFWGEMARGPFAAYIRFGNRGRIARLRRQ